LLNKLRLNDRLIIGDRRYLINKVTSNLVKRGDDFELINDIYNAPLASDSLTTGKFRKPGGFYSSDAQSDSVQYVGDNTGLVGVEDLGDGTGWITIDNDPLTKIRTVEFSISANSGSARGAALNIVNLDKTVAKYFITQEDA
jgi:hypothetical protein